MYLQDIRDEVQRRIQDRRVEGGKNRGIGSTIRKEMWDELDKEEQDEWEGRARKMNARGNEGLTDEDVEECVILQIVLSFCIDGYALQEPADFAARHGASAYRSAGSWSVVFCGRCCFSFAVCLSNG